MVCVMDCHGVSWTVMVCVGLLQIMIDCHGVCH